jgi:F0F1-type ATP synthase assembly protein I
MRELPRRLTEFSPLTFRNLPLENVGWITPATTYSLKRCKSVKKPHEWYQTKDLRQTFKKHCKEVNTNGAQSSQLEPATSSHSQHDKYHLHELTKHTATTAPQVLRFHHSKARAQNQHSSNGGTTMTTPAQTPNTQVVGYILIAIAALLTISLIAGDGAGWLIIGAIATGFLYFYRERRLPGLAVPGGILAGVSAGILFDSIFGFDTAFLVGLAGGFYLITRLEPKKHAWAIYPAIAMIGIVILNFVSDSPWVFILGLFALGIHFLNRNKPNTISSSKPETTSQEIQIDLSSSTPSNTSSVQEFVVTSSAFHASLSRLDRLKAWRSNIAVQNQISAQDVLSDAQLEHLAHAPVNSLEGLQDTLEIGQLVKYGQAVLAILQ